MASPSSVISLGYGSWGSVNLLPTLGYGVGEAAPAAVGVVTASATARTPGATATARTPGASATARAPRATATGRG